MIVAAWTFDIPSPGIGWDTLGCYDFAGSACRVPGAYGFAARFNGGSFSAYLPQSSSFTVCLWTKRPDQQAITFQGPGWALGASGNGYWASIGMDGLELGFAVPHPGWTFLAFRYSPGYGCLTVDGEDWARPLLPLMGFEGLSVLSGDSGAEVDDAYYLDGWASDSELAEMRSGQLDSPWDG